MPRLFKLSFSLFVSLILFGGVLFAQSSLSDSPSENGGGTAVTQDAGAPSLPDESSLRLGGSGQTAPETGSALPSRRTSTVWVFFRMIFVLIVVVVLIYFAMNFMRKKMTGGVADDDTFLRKVAQVTIAPGKTVQIVTLLEHAYLLGVTENSIDLLGEINDKELVDAMNLNADRNENTARARNFSDVLSLFLNPKNSEATEGEKKASSAIADFFKSQKEKLKG